MIPSIKEVVMCVVYCLEVSILIMVVKTYSAEKISKIMLGLNGEIIILLSPVWRTLWTKETKEELRKYLTQSGILGERKK